MGSKLVAILGGSASGKTTLANELAICAGSGMKASVISLDSFYKCNADKSLEERAAVNYDHPHAFDEELLFVTLRALHEGRSALIPQYNFATHSRRGECVECNPSELVIVEGILVLAFPSIFSLFSYSVFVDTPDPMRLERRIARDVAERGRTRDSVLLQWQQSVQPMYDKYCRPSREEASEVFSGEKWQQEDVVALLSRIVS
jgi:uridine kinase